MKTILLIISLIVTTISFSQNFKTETTLKSDGSIYKTVTISPDYLGAQVGLKAIINTDTTFYFFYKDQTYTYVTSYQVVDNLTLNDVKTVINYIRQVKEKKVDNATFSSIYISRLMGQIKFSGSVGYSYVNLNMLENNLNRFLNQ